MAEVKTGIFEGMSVPEYESIQALRWSRLSEYLRSPAHGKAAEAKAEDTEALTVGQAIHTAILEPGEFEARFTIVPENAPAKRSNADKQWWADFAAANRGKSIIKPEAYRMVRACAESAYAHPRARLWLTSPKSKREVVVVWMDDEFGMYCKSRIDLVSNVEGLTRVIDVKSALDVSPYAFSRTMSDYHYAGQLAFYLRGLNAVREYDRTAAFIAIEKDPPVTVCYDVGPATLEAGQDEVRKALSTFVDCESKQEWPGYPDGVIDLPVWRLKRGE